MFGWWYILLIQRLAEVYKKANEAKVQQFILSIIYFLTVMLLYKGYYHTWGGGIPQIAFESFNPIFRRRVQV